MQGNKYEAKWRNKAWAWCVNIATLFSDKAPAHHHYCRPWTWGARAWQLQCLAKFCLLSAKRSCSDVHAKSITQRILLMVLKDKMLINVLGSEGYCELLNYIEEGYRIVSTGVILATVWTVIRKKKQQQLVHCNYKYNIIAFAKEVVFFCVFVFTCLKMLYITEIRTELIWIMSTSPS